MTRRRRFRLAFLLGASGLVALGAALAWHSWAESRARAETLARARRLVDRGFFSLASRLLEPYAGTLTESEEGCQLLIASLYGARRMEGFNRITQPCASRGFGTPVGLIGSTEVYESQGNPERAIEALTFGSKVYEHDGRFPEALAPALRRAGRIDEAAAAYLGAARLLPRDQVDFSYRALSFFSDFALWKEARLMAERLKPEDLPGPERRLTVARALLRGGAPAEARTWVASVLASAGQDPDSVAYLSGRFSDVLGSKPGEAR